MCVSNRYTLNKLEDELKGLPLVITNEDDIHEGYVNLIIKNISEGFTYLNYIFISEREIFGREDNHVTYNSKFHCGTKIRNINALKVGDYIVYGTAQQTKCAKVINIQHNNVDISSVDDTQSVDVGIQLDGKFAKSDFIKYIINL
jgi:UDP-N-acetylmuramyl tripeptide synthase